MRFFLISLFFLIHDSCMSSASIRKAIPGDEAQIHEAHIRSIREICVKDHLEDEVRGWGNRLLEDRWIEAIKTQHVWVIELENQIYGVGYLRILENETFFFFNHYFFYYKLCPSQMMLDHQAVDNIKLF
jgi:hypothetical protein